MKSFILSAVTSLLVLTTVAQSTNEKKNVLSIIDQFFSTMENQDSVAFRDLHMAGARFYIIAERNDTARALHREVTDFSFDKDEVIKERMRDTGVIVQVQNRIATVWAPYDLWVNNEFSHCGIDVFTLIKTSAGWKIASCSYTIEKNNCGNRVMPK